MRILRGRRTATFWLFVLNQVVMIGLATTNVLEAVPWTQNYVSQSLVCVPVFHSPYDIRGERSTCTSSTRMTPIPCFTPSCASVAAIYDAFQLLTYLMWAGQSPLFTIQYLGTLTWM